MLQLLTLGRVSHKRSCSKYTATDSLCFISQTGLNITVSTKSVYLYSCRTRNIRQKFIYAPVAKNWPKLVGVFLLNTQTYVSLPTAQRANH